MLLSDCMKLENNKQPVCLKSHTHQIHMRLDWYVLRNRNFSVSSQVWHRIIIYKIAKLSLKIVRRALYLCTFYVAT